MGKTTLQTSSPAGAETPSPTPPAGPVRRAWRAVRRGWAALRRRWYTRWAVDLLLIALIFWGIGRYQSRNLLQDEVVAPGFTLQDLDGTTRSLSDYRGKTVVLQFFAPWCSVCRFESDNWARIQSWEGEDVQVLAVALAWEDRASVEEFVGDDKKVYPVLLGNDAVQAAYKVESFPTHYIVDPEGRIAWQGAGYTPTVGLWLRL